MLRVTIGAGAILLLVVGSILPVRGDALPEVKQHLLEDIKYLASDEMEGRGVGTKGLTTAAGFIKTEFGKAGLSIDRVDGDAFQKFDLVTGSKLLEPNSLELTGPDGQVIMLKIGTDVEVCSFGGSRMFDGQVVFCGYGIDTNEGPTTAGTKLADAVKAATGHKDPHADANSVSYNDFSDIDVEGKVVIVMRRNPRQSDPKSPLGAEHGTSRFADLRTKMKLIAAYKAAAVLFVNDPYAIRKAASTRKESVGKANEAVFKAANDFLSADSSDADKVSTARTKLSETVNQSKSLQQTAETANDDKLMAFGYAGNGDTATPPAFHIPIATCNKMLASIKTDLTQLESEIDADLKPKSRIITGWRAKGGTSIEKVRADVSNVIAVIDGEGPLADETVVVGAHYDHVGRGGENSLAPGSNEVHNGADDNASGTVTLLELARRFSEKAHVKKPARRIVFIAFTGEELGLLGSARYCKNPVYPLENTIAMLNMDMVGRLKDDKLLVYGTGTSPRWEPELNKMNSDLGFKLIFKPEGFGPSDHSSFYAKKIPVLHFFTGEHPDYHKPTDDWEKINIDGMARVADLMERMIADTVDQAERPQYVEVKNQPGPARGGNRPYVGTIPEFSNEDPGYSISGVTADGPAEKAGLKGGDRIVKVGPHDITNLSDFDAALRKFAGGDEVDFVAIRDKKEIKFKVTLGQPR